MKKLMKTVAVALMLTLLFCACAAQAGETAQRETVLVLLSDGMGESFYVMTPLLFTFDYTMGSLRVTHFYFETQIEAVTKSGETLRMPMTFLSYCDPAAIVDAFENTFGIAVDRYLIYQYSGYAAAVEIYGMLCPVTVDIPEEIMGDTEYSTVNGTMKMIAKALKADYTPVEQAGSQAVDSLGLLSYFFAIPGRVWDSPDRLTMFMEDYKFWDAKIQQVVEALNPVLARMDSAAFADFLRLMTDGQKTDITQDDILRWSAVSFTVSGGAYFTVPGFTGVGIADFDAGALTGVGGYDAKMLTYDAAATAASLQAFINGD